MSVAAIEPCPGSPPILSAWLLDNEGPIPLERVHRPGAGPGFEFPTDTPALVRFNRLGAPDLDWEVCPTPPPGYRFRLNWSDVRERGFAGALLPEAFDALLRVYADRLALVATRPMRFKLWHNGPELALNALFFKARTPAGSFEGSHIVFSDEAALSAFQRHMSPFFAAATGQPAYIDVPVLAPSGERTPLRVCLEWAGERLRSWRPSHENLGNALILGALRQV